MRELTEAEIADLDKRFGYHPPSSPAVMVNHEYWRGACRHLAEMAKKTLPTGREQSLVLTHIEEAMFWGNAAIAREQWPLADAQPKVEVRSAGDDDPLGQHKAVIEKLLPDGELKPSQRAPMINRPNVAEAKE